MLMPEAQDVTHFMSYEGYCLRKGGVGKVIGKRQLVSISTVVPESIVISISSARMIRVNLQSHSPSAWLVPGGTPATVP